MANLDGDSLSSYSTYMINFEAIDPEKFSGNIINRIAKQWMLITAGTPESFNTMTASWGMMGELWNKPVATIFVRPQRYTFPFIEKSNTFSLSFFPESCHSILSFCGSNSGRNTDKIQATGLTPITLDNGTIGFEQAELIFECRNLYADFLKPDTFIATDIISSCYKENDFHKMYMAEILAAWKR